MRRNVLDKLPSPADRAWRSRERIRDDLYEFLLEPIRDRPDEQIELWAWYAAYDHVVLAQLWGAMPALPREIPRFTKDLRQLWDDVGRPPLPRDGRPARRAGRRPAQPGPLAGDGRVRFGRYRLGKSSDKAPSGAGCAWPTRTRSSARGSRN